MKKSMNSKIYASKKVLILFDLIIIIGSICVVLIATLHPFDFNFHKISSPSQILSNFNNVSFFKDQINNLLLFMPFGFGLASFLEKNKIQNKHKDKIQIFWKILIITLLSAALSSTVEVLQIFIPSRTPTPADIMNNTIGGILGSISFSLWNSPILTSALAKIENNRHSPKAIAILFSFYILAIFLIYSPWKEGLNFSNWENDYPLIVGNETSKDRGWNGYIANLNLLDKAIPQQEISKIFNDKQFFEKPGNSTVARYDFIGEGSYPDKTGKTSNLVWQGSPQEINPKKGILINTNNWLQTEKKASYINQRISNTSELTLSTIISTANTQQLGPARIISLSGGTGHRNLTLAQDGSSLHLRLRTPMTGENGSELKLNVPSIFANTNTHHLVITYSEPLLKVYVDKAERFYLLNLLDFISTEQKLFYYTITFIPLGFCLALLTVIAKRKIQFYWILLFTGLLLPSLILEVILVREGGKSLSWKYIIFGIFLTASGMFFLRIRKMMINSEV
jgi:glycopeptide antibiotics resistance protein